MSRRDNEDIFISTVMGILVLIFIVMLLGIAGLIVWMIGWWLLLAIPVIAVGYAIGTLTTHPELTLKETFKHDIKSIKKMLGIKKNG